MARYRNATTDVRAPGVAKYLDTKNRLLVRFRVEKSGRASEVAVDRSKEPPTGVDRPFVAPTVQTAKLPNGMDLFVVERAELPKVDVTFVTRAGAEADPAGKAGLAHMTATQIDMGTATRKALEIEDALGDLGIGLTAAAGRESARVSLRDLEAQPRSGDGDRRRRRPERRISGLGVRPREEAPPRHARAAGEERQRGRGARALDARVRARPSVRPSGAGPAVDDRRRSRATTWRGFHAKYWKPGSSALVVLGRRHARRGDGARNEVFRLLDGRRGPGGHDPAAVAGAAGQALRGGPPGCGADLRDRVRPGAEAADAATTTRSRSPTRCSAAAGSARA